MQAGVLHLGEDEAGQRNGKQESLENVGRGITAVEQIQSPFSLAEPNTEVGFHGSPHSWSLLHSLAVWKTVNSGPKGPAEGGISTICSITDFLHQSCCFLTLPL